LLARDKRPKIPDVVLLPVMDMEPNAWNPNVEKPEKFNLLAKSIEDIGFAENVQVVRHPERPGKWLIVGGEHRWRAARLLGMEEVPAVILEDVDLDKAKALTVRMNILRGEIDPVKFTRRWDEVASKGYGDAILREMFGIASDKEFESLYRAVKESLPPELAAKLEEVKEEIKTVDDLASILNRLFSEYGSTLPSNFMVFVFGGQEHLFVKAAKDVYWVMRRLLERCHKQGIEANIPLRAMLKAVQEVYGET